MYGLLSRLFSVNFQVTLSLPTVFLTLVTLALSLFFFIRYRYLTRYSNDPNSQVKSSDVKKEEIVDSINKKKRKNLNANTNYLDEFLSAIKIFGYLERPVFHELTKNMTTQRLSWDEILYLDEKLGFSIVVDGSVQIFMKVNDNYNSNVTRIKDLNYEMDEMLVIGNQKYQLLNEIKSGVPLSSLNSTLDLFNPESEPSTSPLDHSLDNRLSPLDNSQSPTAIDHETDSSTSSLDLNGQTKKFKEPIEFGPQYPEIIARPKFSNKNRRGATIAIIPGSAFQRIQFKYPKATAHIVTMVKNRLFKVTMNTIHNYLGLSDEIIDSEVKLNSSVESSLPNYLKNSLLERYRDKKDEKKKNEEEFVRVDSESKKRKTRSRPSYDLRSGHQKSSSRLVSLSSVEKPSHPGDLLSSVPISRKSFFNIDNTFRDPFVKRTTETIFSNEIEETEDTSTRIAIIENIFKLMGLTEDSPLLQKNDYIGTSQMGSVSSSPSMIGLTKLANNNADLSFVTNSINKNTLYDNYTSRNRYDSLSSLSSNYSRPDSPKLYNTINQSQLSNYNSGFGGRGTDSDTGSNIFEASQRLKSNSVSQVSSFDFNNVKDDFAKSLEIQYYDPQSVVIEQGSFNCGLYYVIDGSLDVEYTIGGQDGKAITRHRGKIPQGGIAGYLSIVLGIKSLSTVKASKTKGVLLAYISKDRWNKFIDKYYQIQLPLAIRYKRLLSKQILTIDFALEWCHIPAGEVLAAEGDQANGFHIILSGRFRVIQSKGKKSAVDNGAKIGGDRPRLGDDGAKISDDFEVLGEYGHGESIGEVEVLTASRRVTSLIAIRDSETARIPRTLIEILSSQNPSIMVKVSRIVAKKVASANSDLRMMSSLKSTVATPSTINSSPFQSPVSNVSGTYKTITILPTVNGLPVREFAGKLIESLKIIGRNVIALDQTSILNHLGRHAFDDSLAQLKLSGFFASLEEQYETVVYICDSTLRSSWTSTCISQGDCILLLANAEDYDVAVGVGEFEKLLIKYNTTARTDLCLIHPEKYVPFGSTSIWLRSRSWVQGHHHIQMAISSPISPGNLKKKSVFEDIAAKITERTNPQLIQRFGKLRARLARGDRIGSREEPEPSIEPYKNDFLRLARILSNQAIGLVLGGGGARGISHLGIVTALEKHGIPVDIIGGTSIGSFVGGLYAIDYSSVPIYGKLKKFSKRVASYWLSLFDLTLPVTSYLTGHEFNRGIWKVMGFSELEDSWVKFFCNSTNITNSTMEIHEYGPSWRFIRASMSLAGLLPPMIHNGCMLLDGGYLDNLPVLEMKRRGVKYIIAVDVGSVDDRTPMNYGDTLSGLWVVFNRWNPFSKHPDVPNMMDIQSRLAYVASVNALEIAKRTPGVFYLRPPIENFGTLDFGKFEEIYKIGLDYAETVITQWEKDGSLAEVAEKVKRSSISSKRPNFRRNSF